MSHLLRNVRKQAATYLFWLMHKETQCKKQTETSLLMLLENVLMTENCIGHHCCHHYHHHYMQYFLVTQLCSNSCTCVNTEAFEVRNIIIPIFHLRESRHYQLRNFSSYSESRCQNSNLTQAVWLQNQPLIIMFQLCTLMEVSIRLFCLILLFGQQTFISTLILFSNFYGGLEEILNNKKLQLLQNSQHIIF